MTAPSEGIKDILVDAALGTFNTPPSGTWPIYISKLPAEPDNVTCIYDQGGQSPDPKWLLDYPNFVIMVRAAKYPDCYTQISNIRSKLLGIDSHDRNGDRWVSITQLGDIANAGRDEKDRQILTATFRLIIQPASDSYTNRQPL